MDEYANRDAGYAGNMQEQIKALVAVIIDGHEHTEDRAIQRGLNDHAERGDCVDNSRAVDCSVYPKTSNFLQVCPLYSS